MDFIERWLHISPDGGNGLSELLIVAALIGMILNLAIALRHHFPQNLIEFLEQLGKRASSDRFDN